jgi:hypothetical protein
MSALPIPSIVMSTAPVDIAVFSKNRRPILIVDVKGGNACSTVEFATGVRSGLLKHRLLPDAPFFMLATSTQIFLWRGDADPDAHANYSGTTEPILDVYTLRRTNRDRAAIRSGSLEIVMFFWLSDVADGVLTLSPDSEVQRMLLESGVYEQIQGGAADFDVQL